MKNKEDTYPVSEDQISAVQLGNGLRHHRLPSPGLSPSTRPALAGVSAVFWNPPEVCQYFGFPSEAAHLLFSAGLYRPDGIHCPRAVLPAGCLWAGDSPCAHCRDAGLAAEDPPPLQSLPQLCVCEADQTWRLPASIPCPQTAPSSPGRTRTR